MARPQLQTNQLCLELPADRLCDLVVDFLTEGQVQMRELCARVKYLGDCGPWKLLKPP